MKRNVILSLSFFLLIACGSDERNDILVKNDESLAGEWQLVEQNISAGGPSSWEKVDNGPTFILAADGTFEGLSAPTIADNCNTGLYTLTEEELTLTYNCTTISENFIYSCSLENGDLILRPKTVLCFEECATKYRKID